MKCFKTAMNRKSIDPLSMLNHGKFAEMSFVAVRDDIRNHVFKVKGRGGKKEGKGEVKIGTILTFTPRLTMLATRLVKYSFN